MYNIVKKCLLCACFAYYHVNIILILKAISYIFVPFNDTKICSTIFWLWCTFIICLKWDSNGISLLLIYITNTLFNKLINTFNMANIAVKKYKL
jgi:hypothetical protein